jgi:prepilin-type processing-associated H-X9-DG protein
MYCQDDDDWMPIHYGDNLGTPSTTDWATALIARSYITANVARHGCPSTQFILPTRSYGYNAYSLGASPADIASDPTTYRHVKLGAIKNPSDAVMVMDACQSIAETPDFAGYGEIGYWDPNWLQPGGSKTPIGHPSKGVGNGVAVNVLWCDGHVGYETLQDLWNQREYYFSDAIGE